MIINIERARFFFVSKLDLLMTLDFGLEEGIDYKKIKESRTYRQAEHHGPFSEGICEPRKQKKQQPQPHQQ